MTLLRNSPVPGPFSPGIWWNGSNIIGVPSGTSGSSFSSAKDSSTGMEKVFPSRTERRELVAAARVVDGIPGEKKYCSIPVSESPFVASIRAKSNPDETSAECWSHQLKERTLASEKDSGT